MRPLTHSPKTDSAAYQVRGITMRETERARTS